MLKLTVFQGLPSLTKQPNRAIMENNQKRAILSLKKKERKKLHIFLTRSVLVKILTRVAGNLCLIPKPDKSGKNFGNASHGLNSWRIWLIFSPVIRLTRDLNPWKARPNRTAFFLGPFWDFGMEWFGLFTYADFRLNILLDFQNALILPSLDRFEWN